jgi:Fe2+ transport system protein FeoA
VIQCVDSPALEPYPIDIEIAFHFQLEKGHFSFMFQTFIVTLRQGAEAALLAGIALTYLTKDRIKDRPQTSKKIHLRRTHRLDGAAPDENSERVKLEISELRVALTDLEIGEAGTIDHISLPLDEQQFLMRIGFVPGAQVRFSRRAPLGDPSVYAVDGTEIALRAETAHYIKIRRGLLSPFGD